MPPLSRTLGDLYIASPLALPFLLGWAWGSWNLVFCLLVLLAPIYPYQAWRLASWLIRVGR